MHYGDKFPRIHSDQTDRIGIRTMVMSQLWQASKGRLSVDELDAEAPAAPEAPSGMEFIGRDRRPMAGGLREFWTFTGVHGNGKDVTFKTYGNSPDYHFDPGFSQVSILKHRNIQSLMDRFEGVVVDTEIVWRPILEEGGGNDAGGPNLAIFKTPNQQGGFTANPNLGLSNRGGSGRPNPMYGEQDFLRIEGTYTYRYAARDLRALNSAVRIYEAGELPGEAPAYAGRNYLVGAQPYQRHGPVYAITMTAWLSGDGGWNHYIYR